MPIYEYSCEKCHHVFEEWVRHIDDQVDQACPDCGSPAHRIVSNTSFVLKGGGWYVTDYGYRKGKDEGKPGAAGGKQAEAAPAQVSAPAADAAASPARSGSSDSSGGSGSSGGSAAANAA